jgi:hypothetical protein
MGISYKGSKGQTKRAVALQEEEKNKIKFSQSLQCILHMSEDSSLNLTMCFKSWF